MRAFSRGFSFAGLLLLAGMMASPPGVLNAILAAPLLLALVAGLAGLSRWAIATAILMLPYFSYGTMEAIANPGTRLRGVLFAALAAAVFLASLDSMRRR